MAKTKVPGGYISDEAITVSHLHSSHGITTNNIGEHTNNKYYTDARVDARLAASKSTNIITTGDIQITSDSGKAKFGTSNDFAIYHTGYDTYLDNATGHLVLRNQANDKDIVLQTDDGSGGTADYMRLLGAYDRILFSKSIRMADTKGVQLGDGSDFQASFNGNHTFIANNTGILYLTQNVDDGVIHIRNDDGSGGVTNYITLHGGTGEVRLGHYGNVKLATKSTGVDITGDLSLSGNLTVTGTTTTVNTVTMNAQNAVVFEGATADAHETTLTIIDPTADRTINLPNQSGTIPVLAAASNTAITATPAELNYVDGVTSAIQTQLDSKQATISSSTDLTLSSIVATSSNESRFNALSIGPDADIYLYQSATNEFTIRTGTSGAYKYFTFESGGNLNLLSGGLETGGTERISSGGNLTNIGTIGSGAITSSGDITSTGTIKSQATSGTNRGVSLTINGEIAQTSSDASYLHLQRYHNGRVAIGNNSSSFLFVKNNIETEGNIDINTDSGQLQFGADNDMQISHNGATGEINIATGNFLIDSVGNIALDADGGQVSFKDNGTLKSLIDFTGNNVEIQSRVTDADLLFRGQDGASFITALTLDMSDAGKAIFNSGATIPGDVVIGSATPAGTHALKVYHTDNYEAAKFETNTAGALGRFTDTTASVEFGVQSGQAVIRTSNTARIKINSSGVINFNSAYNFPTADGTNGQVLQTNGSGQLSFATVSGGGSGFTTITEPEAGQIKIGAQSGANEGGEILLEKASANGGGSYTTDIHLDNYQNQFRVHAAGTVLFQSATGTGNTTVGGTLTSGDITIADATTPVLTLSDTGNAGGGAATGKIAFNNTAGTAMGIGYTSNIQSNSDMIISTNAGGTHGGYLGLAANAISDAQSDIILEPKTNVRIATGSLEMGTTEFVDQSRNVTAGNITFAEYLYHSGDTDTNLRFQTDRATLTSGGGAIVDAHSNGNLYLTGSTVQVYGNIAFNGSITGNGSALTTLNASNLSSGTVAEARLPSTARRDQTGSTANYGPWYGTATFTYDATNGTRYFWLLIGTIAASDSRGMIEYEVKDDENYPMGLRGTLFFSGFNSGASFSVQHDVTTAYTVGHEPQVRLDTSRRIWMRFPSNDWASYMRFRVHKQGAFTTNTSWSTGTTRYDTAGSPSAPANASSDILPGQNLRATSSSVTGTVPTYAHAFTSDRIKARKGFFGGKISVGSGQTDVNGTYDLYNNGTSYFNGAVTIDDSLTVNSSGNLQLLQGNLTIGTLGSTANGYLYLTGSTANKRADLYCSNGNLHIDADHGNGIYLNWYGAQSATSTAGTFFGNANAGQVARIDGSGNFTLSGTVDGRDVAADGTKLDGIAANANNYSFPYTVSSSAGNSSVVQRTSNGYIFANYFNTTANDVSSGITKLACETSNDSYIRWGTAAAVRSFLNVADGANNITNNNQLTNGAGYITSSGTAANATQAGGLSVHTGRNSEANKIVRTDGNGYIQAGWINTTSGSQTGAMDRIYASTDAYIRYYTPANFFNTGGMGEKQFNNQGRVHGTYTNFNTDMPAGVHYVQGGTNGPTGTSGHQFYGIKFGLGSNYGSTSGSGQYSAQMYFPRAAQGGGNGLYFRDMENGSFGSWRQVDAGTVTGFAPSAGSSAIGASQLLRSHTNNYIYTNWINVGGQGIYSGTNGAHFYPNTGTSYGTWRINGTRGGYSGIMMDGGGDVVVGMFDGSGNGGSYREASSKWYHYFHLGNTCMGINGSTTSSSYALYVNGAIYATGDVVGSSDERLKTEIKTIPNALDKVLKLRGVTYKWIDPEEGGTCVNNITETRMGVIAQEVVDVVPEVVTHDKENDRYGVSYGHLTGVLIEAVKELKQEVNELKKELEEVKNG